MKKWKKLPYWLKGGIISLVIGIIIGIFKLAKEYTLSGDLSSFLYAIQVSYLILIIPYLLCFFIAGLIIGFFIDKIRNLKKQPYWIEGGIIGLIFSLLILILLFSNYIDVWPLILVIPGLTIDLLIKIGLFQCVGEGCGTGVILLIIPLAILEYTLIGALIGLIIDKIKKK